MILNAKPDSGTDSGPAIEPLHGEPTRYLVRSQSRPGLVHLVDTDYEGAYACSCEDHMVRNRDCPHIRLLRAHLKK